MRAAQYRQRILKRIPTTMATNNDDDALRRFSAWAVPRNPQDTVFRMLEYFLVVIFASVGAMFTGAIIPNEIGGSVALSAITAILILTAAVAFAFHTVAAAVMFLRGLWA
jgi:hypothetical protein